jgi:hypothetical protein
VLRGGAWNNPSDNARSANRNDNNPDNQNDNIGFRCVVAPTPLHDVIGQKKLQVHGPAAGATEREDDHGPFPATAIPFSGLLAPRSRDGTAK